MPIARSLARSIVRPIDRSIARSIARSLGRSIGRSLDRSVDLAVWGCFKGLSEMFWHVEGLIRSRVTVIRTGPGIYLFSDSLLFSVADFRHKLHRCDLARLRVVYVFSGPLLRDGQIAHAFVFCRTWTAGPGFGRY